MGAVAAGLDRGLGQEGRGGGGGSAALSNFQGPILAMGFGFCTGIQNQLAVLTGLALVELKEK